MQLVCLPLVFSVFGILSWGSSLILSPVFLNNISFMPLLTCGKPFQALRLFRWFIFAFSLHFQLDKLLASQKQKLDGVVFFDTPEETLVQRICGRRIHPASGRVYHTVFRPPKVPGKDDVRHDCSIALYF